MFIIAQWNIVITAALKALSRNSNTSVIAVRASRDHGFTFKLDFPGSWNDEWFFYWNLDIPSIMLQDSGYYLDSLFKLAFPGSMRWEDCLSSTKQRQKSRFPHFLASLIPRWGKGAASLLDRVEALAPHLVLLLTPWVRGVRVPCFCSPCVLLHTPGQLWKPWLFSRSQLVPSQQGGEGAPCYCWVGHRTSSSPRGLSETISAGGVGVHCC